MPRVETPARHRSLRRIHAITDNLFFWQGLRWVPLGVALVLVSIALSPVDPLPKVLRPWVGTPLLVAAFWLSQSVIGRHYARTVGRVQMDHERHTTRTAIKWLVACPALAFAMVADAHWRPPVLVSAIVLALLIEAYRESTGGGRLHYVAASVGFMAIAQFPLWNVMAPGVGALSVVMGYLGAIYVIGGVLDHRELLHALGTPTETDDVGAV
jgi:hypothetical protein